MGLLISFLCFLSGVTGLVYEVLWAKYLGLSLGSTALAQTLVLATFLGGLAIGNAYFGNKSDRMSPLRLYAYLELGIAGIAGLLSPFFLEIFPKVYIWLGRSGYVPANLYFLVKACLSCGVVLLPAILMGGTIPALTRFVSRSLGQVEASIARLYFFNSAGAVIGALITGFLLIPAFGLKTPFYLTGLLNLLIGSAALWIKSYAPRSGRVGVVDPGAEEIREKTTDMQMRVMRWAIFFSGCASMAYEIAWTRLLALVMGSSTYSFTLMLAAFISGIAIGGYLVSRRIFPKLSSFSLFGTAEIGIGLSIIFTLPYYEYLPYVFLVLNSSIRHVPTMFYVLEAVKFAICFTLMFVPCVCLGMTLPLASRALSRSLEKVGRSIGNAFSLNTLGNVLGAFLSGICLLPILGLRGLIEAGVAVNLAIGCAVLGASPALGPRSRRIGACAMIGGFFAAHLFLTPDWNKQFMISGLFRGVRHPIPSYDQLVDQMGLANLFGNKLLFYKDDHETTISVEGDDSKQHYSLKVGGKTDASTKFNDMTTQILLAHIPLALKPDAKDVLMIGLGSGVSAGSALLHPLNSLDIVEISKAMKPAAEIFNGRNYDVLRNPSAHLYFDDAESYLKVTPKEYDMILNEPSNPWVAGIGNIFTAEFYREAHSHLRPNGLMVQWLHVYEMSDDLLRLILRTFGSSFQNISLWEMNQNDFLLLGSDKPIPEDFGRLESEFKRNEKVQEDLKRISIGSFPTLLSLQTISGPSVRDIAGGGLLNLETHPRLEYEAPKAFFMDQFATLVCSGDERRVLEAPPLILSRYLRWRKSPLSREELADLVQYHKQVAPSFYDSFYMIALRDWLRRFPGDMGALTAWAGPKVALKDLKGKLSSARDNLVKNPNDDSQLKSEADLLADQYRQQKVYYGSGDVQKPLNAYMRIFRSGFADKANMLNKIGTLYLNETEYRRVIAGLNLQ